MIISKYSFIFVLGALTLAGLNAKAFPTMVKHGYTTCITCHYSPSGGGAMTNYGKFIAGELFGRYNDSSTALPWLRNPTMEDKFEKKFFNTEIDWILGSQGRIVQSYFDTPTVKRASPHLMQFDVEAGFSIKQFIAVIQTGFRGAMVAEGQKPSDLNVRQYYAGFRDLNYAVRVGKFFPEFGIKHPNHNIPTRKGLFFNHNEEPNLIQASYYLLNADFNIGYLQGNKNTKLADKKGLVGTVTYRTDHTRSGFSYLSAANGDNKSTATSIFTALGYLEHGYTLAEYAINQTKSSTRTNQVQLAFVESGWEITKAVIPYIGYQRTKAVSSNSVVEYIPLGIKLYPITHFELNGEYGMQFYNTAGTKEFGYAGFLMGHWYF